MRSVLVSGFLRLAFGNLCPLIWYKAKCHLWKTNVPEKMVARSHVTYCSLPFCLWRLLLELILVNFKSIQSIMALNFSNGSKAFDVWVLEACLASLELKFLYIGTIDQRLFQGRGKRQFTLPMVVLWSPHYYTFFLNPLSVWRSRFPLTYTGLIFFLISLRNHLETIESDVTNPALWFRCSRKEEKEQTKEPERLI